MKKVIWPENVQKKTIDKKEVVSNVMFVEKKAIKPINVHKEMVKEEDQEVAVEDAVVFKVEEKESVINFKMDHVVMELIVDLNM